MPVSFGGFGGSTNMPFGPPNDWMTPTEGFPGSPTVAIVTVTTPRLATTGDAAPEAVPLVAAGVVAVDFPPPPHAVRPTDTATTTPKSATRRHRIESPRIAVAARPRNRTRPTDTGTCAVAGILAP